jgi:organic hydroperoxide reductase OsmC/OhrA
VILVTFSGDREHHRSLEQQAILATFIRGLPTGGNMQETHNHRIKAWWTSGRTGIANCDSSPSAIHFTAPPQFGGLEGRWTPEDLLLTAIGSCFATTFRVLAEYSKLPYADLQVEVAGSVQKATSGYVFTEIITRPLLTTSAGTNPERALLLLYKTQELCLITRALSVSHRFDPSVTPTKESYTEKPN